MITFEVVTLTGVKLAKDVHEVRVPTEDGEIAVFDNSAELVALVTPGVVTVASSPNLPEDQLEHLAVGTGVVEVNKHKIRLMVDEASKPEEVLVEEAQAALETAQSLSRSETDRESLEKALASIQAQQARIKVAEIKNLKRRR